MDNLTHSLVGLFLGRIGLRKLTPNGLGVAILAANAPDFDVITWLWGRDDWLRWHRNFTHALLGLPVMALLTIVIIRIAGRKPIRWWPAFLVAAIGVASHIMLDLTNVYGVRLLLPFSGEWFHWDLTPVLDLTIWAMLLAGVFAPMLGRLVSSEIGSRAKSTGAGWAMVALLALGAYDYSRSVLHERAVNLMASRIWNGLAAASRGLPGAEPAALDRYRRVEQRLRRGSHRSARRISSARWRNVLQGDPRAHSACGHANQGVRGDAGIRAISAVDH